jgi:hypothetical protein
LNQHCLSAMSFPLFEYLVVIHSFLNYKIMEKKR